MVDEFPRVARALLSVADKRGLLDFAKVLVDHGVDLISTGGTHKALAGAGLPVTEVAAVTGIQEMMDGRVKTLHPAVHGGLLARRDREDHRVAMSDNGIEPIDLLVSNLYPFEETVAAGAEPNEIIEQIDIGGPAMIRSAAKNHDFVAVVTDPGDYRTVVTAFLDHDGALPTYLRKWLAAKAFARTAAYDAAIAHWFATETGRDFPETLNLAASKGEPLRYGENPHQRAAFYRIDPPRAGVATAIQIQGKALSYNNLNDTDAAFELVAEFDRAAIAIIKHANPCGVAEADSLEEAYRLALRCDPVSAFGGIIAANRPIDEATAKAIVAVFAEVVIAPAIEDAARAVFAAKKNLRVLETGGVPDPSEPGTAFRSLAGGLLAQDRDTGRPDPEDLRVVTKREPSDQERRDLVFAFRVAKHVKSNAIVYARDGATVGIGAGQMSRVDSARIAARKASDAATTAGLDDSLAVGSVVASDAFFPFADGLLAAVDAGATAVIQPGGSVRDDEVIAAADANGLAMVFTGLRHFRH